MLMEEPQHTIDKPRARGRYSLPKDKTQRQIGKVEVYAYTFKDPQVGSFPVLNSASGWWAEKINGVMVGMVKLQKIFDAYKIDANDEEACFYAGISMEQLRYFKELHPDFYQVKRACGQNLGLIAKKAFAKQVENGEGALTYLRLKRKDEGYNPRIEVTGANGRELFESMSERYKKLTEAVRHLTYDPTSNSYKDEEHPGASDAGVPDAGPDGDGHASASAVPASSTNPATA